jgi:hypothetical protein
MTDPTVRQLQQVIHDQAELFAQSQRDLRAITSERDRIRRRVNTLTRLRTASETVQVENVMTELMSATDRITSLEKLLEQLTDLA